MDKPEQSANEANPPATEGSSPSDDTQAEGAEGSNSNAVRGPIKVRVIDDELDGLTFAHLAAHSQIEEILADLSSPEVAELWSIVVSIEGSFKPLAEENPETVRQFLGSTRLVQDVLLSTHFREKATERLRDPLANFLQLADRVRTLKEQIEAAFPPTEFETTFASARPSAPADLLQYDFLILDLVLNKSKGAIDEMVAYLLAMGNANYPAQIPAIIIMSNSAELTSECLRFSTESQISAAGLLLLPKAKIREAGFGKEGLILSYQQLDRQRGVAHHMRVFMRTWMSALERARSKANTTLWNMDASAMQQIHLSAITEDDPYDEHLNELMSREYLWHVESSSDVATALEALDKCFTEKLSPGLVPPAIGTRFIAPLVNAKVGRDLVSHFTWTGFQVPEALGANSPADALKNFNQLVPFGAVLAPEVLTPETECLVHITQQCDLNAATRTKSLENPVQSAQFAVVLPVEVIEHRMPPHDGENESLVARGMSIGGKEYDFKLAKGRQLALRIPKFIEHATKEKLRVVGRLRHDIATHFLSATVNHMTRVASLKTTRVEVRTAHVFLYGKKLADGVPVMLKENDGTPAVVQVALHNKLHFFQDGTSIRLALWIKEQLAGVFEKHKFDSAAICNTLSIGLKDRTALTNVVDFMVRAFSLDTLKGQLPAERAPDPKMYLVVVESLPAAATVAKSIE
jgi:hypothetical protein